VPASALREKHLSQFLDNVDEVEQLLKIHAKVAGKTPGRKYDVEVLNKSAIVLLVACWEAYVEDLAELALRHLIEQAKSHTSIPDNVLERVAQKHSGLGAWKLAGDGWKTALRGNLKEVLAKTTGSLNTPRAPQVDELFVKTIGLPDLSACWHWNRRSAASSIESLDALVSLRGGIAHRVKHSTTVQKRDVTTAIDFVSRLAARSSNRVRDFIHERTGVHPWLVVVYKGVA